MRPRDRGIAVLIAMLFSMLLFLLGFAFLKLVPSELTLARQEHVRSQSDVMNQSMVQSVLAWLRAREEATGNPLLGLSSQASGDPTWPLQYRLSASTVQGLNTNFLTSSGGNEGRWSSEILLYPDESTRAGEGPHCFRVKVTSRLWGQPITAAQFILQQQTFAKYGFFVDKPPASGYYTAMREDRYEGEFHINGKLPLYVDSKLFSNFVAPVFSGRVSFSKAEPTNPYDSIAYTSTSTKPFDASGATIIDSDKKSRYAKLFALDRSAVRLVSDVSMPQTKSTTDPDLAKAAWFGRNSSADSLATANPPAGVTLNRLADGTLAGIYVKGNVRDLKLHAVNSLKVDLARDAQGLINGANSLIEIREETAAAASSLAATRVLELRDPLLTLTIPAGSKLSINGATANVLSGSLLVTQGKTVLIRDPQTTRNPGTLTVYELYDGFPNGVIFVDGNVGKVPLLNTEQAGGAAVNREQMHSTYTGTSATTGGLSGINLGVPRTIAVNYAKNNYIRICGDVTRADTNPGQTPSTRDSGLGVVAYDVVIGGEIPRQADTKPFYFYSLLMAGRRDVNGTTQAGSVIYEDWDKGTTWGRLYSYGSYVVGQDRLWGSSTQGWMPTFRHDARLASNPPPFYPTRSDYKLQAYREVPAR